LSVISMFFLGAIEQLAEFDDASDVIGVFTKILHDESTSTCHIYNDSAMHFPRHNKGRPFEA
jgi:hypothetical protein